MEVHHSPESIASVAQKAYQLLICCENIDDDLSRSKAAIQMNRFNLWAQNIGVFSQRHASLDYRLRTASMVKTTVEGNLELLTATILSVLAGGRECTQAEFEAFDNASANDVQAFGLRLLKVSEANATKQRLLALESTGNVISILHRLSLAIRRASNRNYFLKTTTLPARDESFTWYRRDLGPESRMSVPEAPFDSSLIFRNYVSRLLLSRWWVNNLENASPCPRMRHYREVLLDRLIEAISARRRQLEYFRTHQTKMQDRQDVSFKNTERHWMPEHHERTSNSQSEPAPYDRGRTSPNIASEDHVTSDRDNTAASSFHQSQFQQRQPSESEGLSIASSQSGTLRNTRAFEIPPTPALDLGEREKMCPYCCLVLPAKTYDTKRRSRNWRHHILEDLQPYVCLHKICASPGKSYHNIVDWIGHMEQPHDQGWVQCPDCPQEDTVPGLEAAISTSQKTIYTEEVFENLHVPQRCFVCLDDQFTSYLSLWKHVARHLNSAFLVALPWRDDIDEDLSAQSSRTARMSLSEDSQEDTDDMTFEPDSWSRFHEFQNMDLPSSPDEHTDRLRSWAAAVEQEEPLEPGILPPDLTIPEPKTSALTPLEPIVSELVIQAPKDPEELKLDSRADSNLTSPISNHSQRVGSGSMPSRSLLSALRGSLQYCSILGQDFLPASSLDDLITTRTVSNELPRSLMNRIFSNGLPSNIITKNARRLFAILVMIGESQTIRQMLHDGHTDDDLPFARPLHQDHSSIVESKRGKEVKSFQGWNNDSKVEMFLETQWQLLAPTMDVSGTSTVFEVDPKCPLPFMRATDIQSGHSNVTYKTELHAAHQTGAGAQNTDMVIAVKVFHKADGFRLFRKEKETLLKIRGVPDRHLIRYLFFCKRDDSYFIAFPWAEGGNLQEFWIRHAPNQKLRLWSLQQMLGLSGALLKLHSINCRHGDLQPGKILHFLDGGLGNLVIAGVGISKVHAASMDMRLGIINNRATKPSYEPPEALVRTNAPMPRRYDIWSMACVYLEFIIWMVYGFRAVNSFAKSREEGTSKMRPSKFYALQEDNAVIHPSVLNAFVVLRSDPRCKGDTAIGALINLITQHLLLIQVDDRVTAVVLYEKLEKIVRRATNDPSFIMNQAEPPRETAAIFGRPVEIPEGLRTATSW